jgi:hypothetical protein
MRINAVVLGQHLWASNELNVRLIALMMEAARTSETLVYF